jgi:hypothetical protein
LLDGPTSRGVFGVKVEVNYLGNLPVDSEQYITSLLKAQMNHSIFRIFRTVDSPTPAIRHELSH